MPSRAVATSSPYCCATSSASTPAHRKAAPGRATRRRCRTTWPAACALPGSPCACGSPRPPITPDVRSGRVYGRGACDMKGGVASMLFATEVLRSLDVPLRGDLIVNTVTDEESTGAGSLAVAAAGLRADGGIIPEPTRLTAWLGTRGSLMPRITVEGRAGHAGFPPAHWSAGGPVNAIEKLQIVLEALQRLRHEWQLRPDCRHEALAPGSIVPTSLHAGQWMVSYPAAATLECHVQYVPGQADSDGYGSGVEREIEQRVLAACAADSWLSEHPPGFEWPGD